MKNIVLVPMALVMFAVLSLHAQEASAPTTPAFEVASIKVNKSGNPGMRIMNQPGGRFSVENLPVKELIRVAYGVQQYQLVGGPDWIGNDRFDVVAKAASDATPLGPPGTGPSTVGLMLQNLLADRFKLKMHKETREMPIYSLVLARADGKLGPKIEASKEDCAARGRGAGPRAGGAPAGPPPPPKPGERPPCGAFMGPGAVAAGSMSMTQLATMLSQRVGRPVVDKTGLQGSYAFNLDFAPELPPGFVPPPGAQIPAADPNAPSIYTALQEQLGLKLDSTKGPVDVWVIDSIDHPTED